MSCFSKMVEIRNLFLFILTFEAAFWRFWTYITRISQTVSKKARQFGSCCHASGNSGVVNKSPVIVLTKVNINADFLHHPWLMQNFNLQGAMKLVTQDIPNWKTPYSVNI